MNIMYNLAVFLLFQSPLATVSTHNDQQSPPLNRSGALNIVFKSTDGGQTWQDISEGLPENIQADYIQRDQLFVNDDGLFLQDSNVLYHNRPNSTTPFWQKATSPDDNRSIPPGKTGTFAYRWDGHFSRKSTGTQVWSPVYLSAPLTKMRNVFRTASGAVFIGAGLGLLKSIDSGKTWNQVYSGGWVMKLVESNGILMATSEHGVLRSTDEGETWESVLNEGGVGIAIEAIKGGFAAINYNTESKTRRVRTSYDGGTTWEAIDASLPADYGVASIVELDGYFLCGHPEGIFRSKDKGLTWKRLLPPITNKTYNLFVTGDIIYAIPIREGC